MEGSTICLPEMTGLKNCKECLYLHEARSTGLQALQGPCGGLPRPGSWGCGSSAGNSPRALVRLKGYMGDKEVNGAVRMKDTDTAYKIQFDREHADVEWRRLGCVRGFNSWCSWASRFSCLVSDWWTKGCFFFIVCCFLIGTSSYLLVWVVNTPLSERIQHGATHSPLLGLSCLAISKVVGLSWHPQE